jgi:UPF0755 protein
MSDSRRRSAEEREAARREREAGRAARGDGPPPAPPVPAPAPAGPDHDEELGHHHELGHDHELDDDEVLDWHEAAEDEAIDWTDHDHDHEHDDGDYEVHEGPEEAPSGIRRVPVTAAAGTAKLEPRRSRRPPGAGPRQPLADGLGGHSWRGRIVAVLAILLSVGLIWFLWELFQPFHGSGQGEVVVRIPPHTSSTQVGDLLARDGVVSSSFFFELRATLAGERGSLRTGTFRMQRDMSYGAALSVLTAVPPPVKVSTITITEGKSRSQIDALLRAQGMSGNYLAVTRHSPLLDPRHYGAPRSTPSLEGFLFPSTYQLRDPVTAATLADEQLRTFKTRFRSINLAYANSKHLTAYDVLIIASIIEGEASTARDRALVASVIYHRLHDNMPLQMDSTTRYASGNYTSPLTASELSSSSPYNTRINKGLPPTPISNPGMAAMQAAAHPAATKYLYFVVKPCGNGEQVFSSSYAQFQRDQARYQAARARRGGRSPANC